MGDLIVDAKAAADRLNDNEVSGRLCMAKIQAVLEEFGMELVWLEHKVNGSLMQASFGLKAKPRPQKRQ